MRISNNDFAELFKGQLQTLQQRQVDLQKRIASGQQFTSSSENPSGFEQTQQLQSGQAQDADYLHSVGAAGDMADSNQSAMTDLQRILGRAGEIATGVSGAYSSSDLKIKAAEIDGIVSQVVTIANRKSSGNGTYLFGGTSNAQPIDPSTDNYGGNNTVPAIEIEKGKSVTTGILAGGTPAGGGPAVDGFLYDGASGVDVIGALRQLSADLKAGNVVAIQNTDLQNINKGLDHVSEYVGLTSARYQSIALSKSALQQQMQNRTTEIAGVAGVSLTDAMADLQKAQLAYTGALQSGARILNLSLLDFLR